MRTKIRMRMSIIKSSIDIEVNRTAFNFFFFHEENSKHLKHKQKESK